MVTREAVLTHIKDKYGVNPDYPWKKFPNYAALRHTESHKWFVLIMNISADKLGLESKEQVDVINLKAEKELIGSLRQKRAIYPAYHMDKSNWVTVHLQEIESMEMLCELIEDSYNLTK